MSRFCDFLTSKLSDCLATLKPLSLTPQKVGLNICSDILTCEPALEKLSNSLLRLVAGRTVQNTAHRGRS
jgi:hypothetical protein